MMTPFFSVNLSALLQTGSHGVNFIWVLKEKSAFQLRKKGPFQIKENSAFQV
jgi:hypothetical protein